MSHDIVRVTREIVDSAGESAFWTFTCNVYPGEAMTRDYPGSGPEVEIDAVRWGEDVKLGKHVDCDVLEAWLDADPKRLALIEEEAVESAGQNARENYEDAQELKGDSQRDGD